MAEYISTFPTGFSEVLPSVAKKLLPGIQVLNVRDGLLHYRYFGEEKDVRNVFVFHNSFQVIRKFSGPACELSQMIRTVQKLKTLPATTGSFRIRYSQNNQFVGRNKKETRQLEAKISALTRCRVDRVNPETEYWFLVRREQVGYFCRLLAKRQVTEKELHPGELRPELAYLLCAMASPQPSFHILDPFAGYGAIPEQIVKHFPCERLHISDLSREMADHLSLRQAAWKAPYVTVKQRDALNMADIPSHSLDAVITDPPWGYYEELGDISTFYQQMLFELERVLKPEGTIVLLSARKPELEAAAHACGFLIKKNISTLVNGKKAGVYVLKNKI